MTDRIIRVELSKQDACRMFGYGMVDYAINHYPYLNSWRAEVASIKKKYPSIASAGMPSRKEKLILFGMCELTKAQQEELIKYYVDECKMGDCVTFIDKLDRKRFSSVAFAKGKYAR